METMSKIQKEADEYKDSSSFKLRFVILIYKGLSFFSSKEVNFVVSFLHLTFLFWFVVRINFFTVSLLILSHYFIFWKYAILKKNWCLVKPEEGEEIDEIVNILEEFLKDKKQLWALTHDIKIYNHDVELYAEEEGLKRPADQGVYSVKYDRWLVAPKKMSKEIDKTLLKGKTRAMMDKIDFLISNRSDDLDEFKKLKEKIREMRSSAIRKGGEFSIENLVFKELRNNGYLEKLSSYITKIEDQSLSLENYVY